MSKSPQNNATDRHHKKMTDLGFIRIHPYVPEKYKDEIFDYTKRVKNRYLRELRKLEEQKNVSNITTKPHKRTKSD